MKYLFTLFLFLPFYVQAQIIITAAGTGFSGFTGDGGPATAAQFGSPYAVTLDKSGNLYICDIGNSRIRKLSPGYNGTITTVAGNGSGTYSGDGFAAIHAGVSGADVAVDWKGNLFIAEPDHSRIRKVNTAGIITTYAGTEVSGYNGDGIAATAARLSIPLGVAVDDTGNLYIADQYNYRIRKVDTFGIITTVAGNGTVGFSPDGSMAGTASLKYLFCIRTDKNGKLFFADNMRIRTIDADGKLRTIAGNGIESYSGDGGPATAASIYGIAISIDTFGNCYLAEGPADRVRKVGTDGIINTIVGTGVTGGWGDWGNPALARLNLPCGVAVAPNGDIFIGDVGNYKIRMVTTYVTEIPENANEAGDFKIYPNPADKMIYIERRSTLVKCTVVMTDANGREVYASTMGDNVTSAAIDVSGLAKGIFYVQVSDKTGIIFTQKIIIH